MEVGLRGVRGVHVLSPVAQEVCHVREHAPIPHRPTVVKTVLDPIRKQNFVGQEFVVRQ